MDERMRVMRRASGNASNMSAFFRLHFDFEGQPVESRDPELRTGGCVGPAARLPMLAAIKNLAFRGEFGERDGRLPG